MGLQAGQANCKLSVGVSARLRAVTGLQGWRQHPQAAGQGVGLRGGDGSGPPEGEWSLLAALFGELNTV